MFSNLSKKITIAVLACLVAAVSIFTVSCQKELSGDGFIITETPPDLTTKVSSSVSGFVTDEADAAVNGATVIAGSASTTTDKYGYFSISNADVVKNAAVVTVIKPGYFKGIKTYTAVTGKAAFFRIKLLPKTSAGSFDAATGGAVTLTNGLSVSFPAAAVVVASTSAAYTGPVTVAAQWINPTANDLGSIMPGDLRGLDSLGFMKLLKTYGMAAVELTGASGELLQVTAGKKATLNFPIPAGISATAPATIPLWYFDETNGLWKQQGNAVKSGSTYTGDVSHFSYWNCDIPLTSFVQFTGTVIDAAGNPVSGANISIKYAGGGYTGAHGYTDSAGYISGNIPANTQLVLEVYSYYNCGNVAYTQNITTTNQTLALGNIQLPAAGSAVVSGTVINCSNTPVTNGYIIMIKDNVNYRFPISSAGTFSFNTLLCNSSVSVTLLAEDNDAQQSGPPATVLLTNGAVPAGELSACGTVIDQFIRYSINGTNYSLTAPTDNLEQSVNLQGVPPVMFVSGSAGNGGSITNSAYIGFDQTGIAANSTQALSSFFTNQINDSTFLTAPASVNIIEYGAIGQFIAGNFACTLTGAPPANTPYNITCNFRVRRNQ